MGSAPFRMPVLWGLREKSEIVVLEVLHLVIIACAVKCRIVPCGKQETVAEMIEVCIAPAKTFEVTQFFQTGVNAEEPVFI